MSVEASVNWIGRLFPRITGRNARDTGPDQTSAAYDKDAWGWEAKPSPKKATTKVLPLFLATAGDQLHSSANNQISNIRVRLSGAFAPSHPITDPKMFAGRTEVLARLIAALEDQRLHSVVFGERGIGKTSLIHVLAQAARDARYHVIYLSCGPDSSFGETIRSIAEDLPLLYHADYGPTAKESETGSSFADLLPVDGISVRRASDLFAKAVGTRVLVLMDEFDRSESVEFRRNIADLMKNLSDRAVRVQLVIAGVATNFTELVAHVPGIRRNIFALELPAMTAPEIRDLVHNGEAATGLTFDAAAIDFVVSVAHGLPYVATLLSHHASLSAVDEGRTVVTADDVSAGIAEALTELSNRISKRSRLQIAEGVRNGLHKVLATLAREALLSGGRFTNDDINALYKGGENASRCRALIDSLVLDGTLVQATDEETGREYRFLEESVPAYFWLLEAQEQFLVRQDTTASESLAQQTAASNP